MKLYRAPFKVKERVITGLLSLKYVGRVYMLIPKFGDLCLVKMNFSK